MSMSLNGYSISSYCINLGFVMPTESESACVDRYLEHLACGILIRSII